MSMCQITDKRRQSLMRFAKKLGVEFNDIEILNTALTHTSYANEQEKLSEDKSIHVMHNEKLEFLGDAVLELASTTYLYNNFKDFSEGELTKTRANIVCQPTLAKLAKKLGIGRMLLISKGEDASGGRKRDSTLEDAFEAVIGAIYLDQGWEVALDYVVRRLTPEFEAVKSGESIKNYKSMLQEFIYKQPSHTISYVEVSVTGPDHNRSFKCAVMINGKRYGTGSGKNKKQAEQMAAKKALKKLNILE